MVELLEWIKNNQMLIIVISIFLYIYFVLLILDLIRYK
jgi:hypothetical protein